MEYRKYKTISWEEFFKSEEEKELERRAAIINRNKKLRKIFITSLGMTLFVVENVYASGVNPFEPVGLKFWGYVQFFAKYACLIMGGIEVIKSLGEGDMKGITRILLKYALAYASFKVLPWIFKEIDRTFINF